MAEDDDERLLAGLCGVERRPHERRADALTLVLGQDGHRRQRQDRLVDASDGDPTEQDVPDDPRQLALMARASSGRVRPPATGRARTPSKRGCARRGPPPTCSRERGHVDGADRRPRRRGLGADEHRVEDSRGATWSTQDVSVRSDSPRVRWLGVPPRCRCGRYRWSPTSVANRSLMHRTDACRMSSGVARVHGSGNSAEVAHADRAAMTVPISPLDPDLARGDACGDLDATVTTVAADVGEPPATIRPAVELIIAPAVRGPRPRRPR